MNGQEKDDEIAGNGNIYSALYWEYDSRSLRRWNLDPKPNAAESMYSCFGGNPIWNSDLLGDTVRKEGFSDKFMLKMLNRGIKVKGENSPYSFVNGDLKIDQDKLANLSPEQQAIVNNIQQAVDDERVFIFKKTRGSDLIPIGYKEISKSIVYDQLWKFGGAATVPNADPSTGLQDPTGCSGVTIYWNGRGAGSIPAVDNRPPNSSAPLPVTVIPRYLIPYHELGGHGVYSFILRKVDQGKLTIDFENIVRGLHGLQMRPVDIHHR